MEKGIIVQLHADFEKSVYADQDTGMDFWLARDLQKLLGYAKWENFAKVIEKARISCKNVDFEPLDHFLDVRKKVELGSEAVREIDDIALECAQSGNYCPATLLLVHLMHGREYIFHQTR